MNQRFTAVITLGLAMLSLPCCAEPACREVVIRAQVEAAQGALRLADLLAPETCSQLYGRAAQVTLGAAPRTGSMRVFDGSDIRRLLEPLGEHSFGEHEQSLAINNSHIPERIVVRQRRAAKTCAEIGKVITAADGSEEMSESSRWRDLDCAAAGNIPEDAPLELMKISWNAGLNRREFALRCTRSEDCIPFLVWIRGPAPATGLIPSFPSRALQAQKGEVKTAPLVKIGQTAMLTWEQANIRIVLPVTCLEAGGLGEFIRVRFKNTSGTVRAEIVGAGTLRASL